MRTRIAVPPDARDIPGDFAHVHHIGTRLADTDAMGHVNNAFYLTYVEIARIAYYEQVVGRPLPLGAHGADEGMILAEIRMTYRTQAYYGETLAVETRVERIGNTSFTMVHRITAPASRYGEPRLVGVAESVLVSYDYREDKPIPVPDDWRAAIATFEGWPQA